MERKIWVDTKFSLIIIFQNADHAKPNHKHFKLRMKNVKGEALPKHLKNISSIELLHFPHITKPSKYDA